MDTHTATELTPGTPVAVYGPDETPVSIGVFVQYHPDRNSSCVFDLHHGHMVGIPGDHGFIDMSKDLAAVMMVGINADDDTPLDRLVDDIVGHALEGDLDWHVDRDVWGEDVVNDFRDKFSVMRARIGVMSVVLRVAGGHPDGTHDAYAEASPN